MDLYYKYYDALMKKFAWLGQRAEFKWWDWRDNVKETFKNAERYHFDCELWERDEVYFRYYTSRNENNLVSFTLFRENWRFKCNSAIWFPMEYSDKKKNDVTYYVYRDCLDDLERIEKSEKN